MMADCFSGQKPEKVVPPKGSNSETYLTSFPSPAVTRKATKFLKEGLVKPVFGVSNMGLRFEVGKTPHTVLLKKGGGFVCSCPHFAIHKSLGCSHIWSVVLWFRGWDLGVKNVSADDVGFLGYKTILMTADKSL